MGSICAEIGPDDHGVTHSKIARFCSKWLFWLKFFSACGVLKRGFAFGSVLHSPKSATLAVAIILVTPQEGVAAPGAWALFIFRF